MNREEYFATWSELHGGASITGMVKGWLIISYAISRPLVFLKISPNLLSAIGVVAALFTYTQARHEYSIGILAISLLSDGVDGTVAILSGLASKRGAMIDAICDRVSEAFWALAFYKLGAPAWIVGTAFVFAFTQEYARARIAGLGDFRIDVVTIAERPVRAAFLAVAIIAFDLKIAALTLLATLWMIQQGIALVTVMRSGYSRLSAPDRLGD
jgi:CDP-diacylglycerol--glycerol-3-phosphate 3-phosphatidyltransferase